MVMIGIVVVKVVMVIYRWRRGFAVRGMLLMLAAAVLAAEAL